MDFSWMCQRSSRRWCCFFLLLEASASRGCFRAERRLPHVFLIHPAAGEIRLARGPAPDQRRAQCERGAEAQQGGKTYSRKRQRRRKRSGTGMPAAIPQSSCQGLLSSNISPDPDSWLVVLPRLHMCTSDVTGWECYCVAL